MLRAEPPPPLLYPIVVTPSHDADRGQTSMQLLTLIAPISVVIVL